MSFGNTRYRVLRPLGEGGQKRVFLVRDTQLDRDVVLSVLKNEASGLTDTGRLTREAQALARLGDHPHIVTIHDIGDYDGHPFIVTEFVSGGSLAERCQHQPDGCLPIRDVIRMAGEVCSALGHAHDRGIVHRDLKPSNVWLSSDGVCKLGDFGLAIGWELPTATRSETLLGTLAYMAPERIAGRDDDPRSDLYSLGVMLFQLATGQLPFTADHPIAALNQHLYAQPPTPSFVNPRVSSSLSRLILQLLAKTPDERPDTAEAVSEALAASPESTSTAPADRDVRSLQGLAGNIFVGRETELWMLRVGVDDALAGRGRVLLLTGDPGSGKTLTAEQGLTYAQIRGAVVGRGSCYDGEGAPAYWPWVQVLRALVSGRQPEDVSALIGSGAASVAELDGEIRRHLPPQTPDPKLDPDEARFRLFDSVALFLRKLSRDQPVAIFLDDLHWADRSSLLMLAFLAREIGEARVLVIATYRNATGEAQQPLARAIGELASRDGTRQVTLQGLSRGDIGHYVERASGFRPSERLIDAVHEKTDGNPFFVKEVVNLLISDGYLEHQRETSLPPTLIPQGVREVITRRLAQISADCRQVLTTAAVVGREFCAETIETISALREDDFVDRLEEAQAARLIVEVRNQPGRYSFTHALVRDALYDALTDARRVRLHRRVADVLEGLYAGNVDLHLAELAHHFAQTADATRLAKALNYTTRAAERADRLLAYEDAGALYEAAARLLERQDDDRQDVRVDLLLSLGQTRAKAGSRDLANQAFTSAMAIARRFGWAERFARAVLGMEPSAVVLTRLGAATNTAEVALLREALQLCGLGDGATRALLLARLAAARYYEGDERVRLSEQAVEVARRVQDRDALVHTLFARCLALEGFERTGERHALATEIIGLAEKADDKAMVLSGLYRRIRELHELGRLTEMEEDVERYANLADSLRQPRYLWCVPFFRAVLAINRGRFGESARLEGEALALGQRVQEPNAELFCTVLRVNRSRILGQFDQAMTDLADAVVKFPAVGAWRVLRIRMLCDQGLLEAARKELGALTAGAPATVRRDGAWVGTVAALCEICWHLGDRPRAEVLYDQLLPFEALNSTGGNTLVFGGPISEYLALLAATRERWDEAEERFEQAIDRMSRAGIRPWVAKIRYEYARMLHSTGQPDRMTAARSVANQAVAIAEPLGMQWIVEGATKLIRSAA